MKVSQMKALHISIVIRENFPENASKRREGAESMRRLTCLDGLRGLLALYVMVSHVLPFAVLPATLDWLGGWLSHGGAAVDIAIDANGRFTFDVGITFFDTADAYNFGRSEEIMGATLMKMAKREEFVLSTKVGIRMSPVANDQGTGRKHLMASVDAAVAAGARCLVVAGVRPRHRAPCGSRSCGRPGPRG